MRQYDLLTDRHRDHNALAFWYITKRGEVHIQAKRLPKNTPEEIKTIQRLFVKNRGTRIKAVVHIRQTTDFGFSDSLKLVNEILSGKW